MSKHYWGPWKLDPRVAVLYIDKPEYHIDLTRCTSAGGVLGWISHMTAKTWMDDAHLVGLVRAFDDLFSLNWGARFPATVDEVHAHLRHVAHEDDIRPHVVYLESGFLGMAKQPSDFVNDPDLPEWLS